MLPAADPDALVGRAKVQGNLRAESQGDFTPGQVVLPKARAQALRRVQGVGEGRGLKLGFRSMSRHGATRRLVRCPSRSQ
jgi:hypothetical protein